MKIIILTVLASFGGEQHSYAIEALQGWDQCYDMKERALQGKDTIWAVCNELTIIEKPKR